jgi:hypothetical protein
MAFRSAGLMMLPSVSVPSENMQRLAETEMALPVLLPPGLTVKL